MKVILICGREAFLGEKKKKKKKKEKKRKKKKKKKKENKKIKKTCIASLKFAS